MEIATHCAQNPIRSGFNWRVAFIFVVDEQSSSFAFAVHSNHSILFIYSETELEINYTQNRANVKHAALIMRVTIISNKHV